MPVALHIPHTLQDRAIAARADFTSSGSGSLESGGAIIGNFAVSRKPSALFTRFEHRLAALRVLLRAIIKTPKTRPSDISHSTLAAHFPDEMNGRGCGHAETVACNAFTKFRGITPRKPLSLRLNGAG